MSRIRAKMSKTYVRFQSSLVLGKDPGSVDCPWTLRLQRNVLQQILPAASSEFTRTETLVVMVASLTTPSLIEQFLATVPRFNTLSSQTAHFTLKASQFLMLPLVKI